MIDATSSSKALAAPASTATGSHANLLVQATLPVALVALLLGFGSIDRRVIGTDNLLNILQQTSYLAIFAMAQTVVILTRGFDLALGPTVSMVSVGTALAMARFGGGVDDGNVGVLLVGLLAGIALSSAVGLFNGVLIAAVGVSPFVTTLGSYNVATGIATTLSGGRPVQGVPTLFDRLLYGGTLFGVPSAVVIAVATGIVLHLVLQFTTFGRSLYLIGTNARAAAVAGLPVRRMLIFAYLLSSMLTAFGAVMLTARTGSGEPNLGGSLSLQGIAAAIIGGTSLAGGSGGVLTAVFGALFVTILSNGMDLVRINGYVQMIVLGAIVILGVMLDRLRSKQS